MAAYKCINCGRIDDSSEDCCDRPDLFKINDMTAEIKRLRAALAALKSGEPRDALDGWDEWGAAPPAPPPPKGLFVDLIAQHPSLAEELKAIDDAPMPTVKDSLTVQPPNVEGETMCVVRWMAETPHGWVGSYDKAALECLEVKG